LVERLISLEVRIITGNALREPIGINNGVANFRMLSIHWPDSGFEIGSLPPEMQQLCNPLDVLKMPTVYLSDRGI
jgi:hypothetical protein